MLCVPRAEWELDSSTGGKGLSLVRREGPAGSNPPQVLELPVQTVESLGALKLYFESANKDWK